MSNFSVWDFFFQKGERYSIYNNMPAANGMMHRRSLVFMSTSKYLMRSEHVDY